MEQDPNGAEALFVLTSLSQMPPSSTHDNLGHVHGTPPFFFFFYKPLSQVALSSEQHLAESLVICLSVRITPLFISPFVCKQRTAARHCGFVQNGCVSLCPSVSPGLAKKQKGLWPFHRGLTHCVQVVL